MTARASSENPLTVFIYGYGNPSRGDDGAGIALAERLEETAHPHVKVDTNYQLNAEDALAISAYDIVIFADASQNDIEHFSFTSLQPAPEVTFTTHAMAPSSVVALCRDLYAKQPDAFLLEIKGYSWELGEPMTPQARHNLDKACSFLYDLIAVPHLQRFRQAAAG
ncbi:MAG: hydrogenase maturation protease [Chitinivibrionales bacterium]|nr:hydrogenase maturation protease [Chitinivibrionales bacterium]